MLCMHQLPASQDAKHQTDVSHAQLPFRALHIMTASLHLADLGPSHTCKACMPCEQEVNFWTQMVGFPITLPTLKTDLP